MLIATQAGTAARTRLAMAVRCGSTSLSPCCLIQSKACRLARVGRRGSWSMPSDYPQARDDIHPVPGVVDAPRVGTTTTWKQGANPFPDDVDARLERLNRVNHAAR